MDPLLENQFKYIIYISSNCYLFIQNNITIYFF